MWPICEAHWLSDGRSTAEYHKREQVVSDKEELNDDGEYMDYILAESTLRDSSIYRNIMDFSWKKEFLIAERNESK